MQRDLDNDEELKECIKAMTNDELTRSLGFHLKHMTLLLAEVDERLAEIQRR